MRAGNFVLVVVLGLGLGGAATACKEDPAAKPPAADVARGAYVARLAGCPACHTPLIPGGAEPDPARGYAGGLEVTESFGVWRAPNITPNPATGIGAWTDAQIAAAIREGKRPDGTMLKAVMPYTFYAGMTDDDVAALVAFLRSVPPVVHRVERVVPPLPDIPAPPLPRIDDRSDPVRHGQYLAGIAHCALCHTPLGPGGPDLTRAFAGGVPIASPSGLGVGALVSSNITSDAATGIGRWTADDIVRALRQGQRPDGRPILGPMMLYTRHWSQLTDADAQALAAFVKTIPPVATPASPE